MMKLSNSSGKLQELLENVTYRQWVIAAVTVSCLMGLLVFFALSGADSDRKDAAKVQTVKVVVAKQDIPDRTVVQENMLKVIEVPADIIPAGAFGDVSEVIDHPTSTMVQQGDILTDKKVYTDVRMAGFTGTIPPNCRAVSVGITDITGVSGFAKAGDYVDVMVISGKKEDGIKGEILMQNVLLLALNKTGAQAEKGDKDKKDIAATKSKDKDKDEASLKGSSDAMATATLALPLDEALKLAVAAQKGTIYLVLRPYHPTDILTLDREYSMPGDKPAASPTQTTVPASSAPVQSQTSSYTPPVSTPSSTPAPAAPAAPRYGNSIEVIRGTESSRVGV